MRAALDRHQKTQGLLPVLHHGLRERAATDCSAPTQKPEPRGIQTRENPHRGRARPRFVPRFQGQNALRGSGSRPATVPFPHLQSDLACLPTIVASLGSEHTEGIPSQLQSRTDAESVKALDRFAAHIRAALTDSAFGCKHLPLGRNASECSSPELP